MGTRTQHKIKRKSPHLQELIALLKKKAIETKVPLWKRLATDLEGPRRNRTTVPITTIQKTIRKGEIAVVSGKIVGEGTVENTIAAFQCSATVKNTNKVISLEALSKENPKGAKCRIFG